MNLELMAMRWLWLERKCHYIVEQRSPRYRLGSPDVLGVTKDRYLVEIEIKRSVSDFRADFRKRHRINRDSNIADFPKQFYYLTPKELAEKLLPKIPEWAGLMCGDESGYSCTVMKVAPVNRLSQKLSIRECVKMCRCMANHMMTTLYKLDTERRRFIEQDSTLFVNWTDAKVGTYEI